MSGKERMKSGITELHSREDTGRCVFFLKKNLLCLQLSVSLLHVKRPCENLQKIKQRRINGDRR